jgi:hypothetical protein
VKGLSFTCAPAACSESVNALGDPCRQGAGLGKEEMPGRHIALAAVLLSAIVLANGSVETDSTTGRALKQLFGGAALPSLCFPGIP